jgi:hypothetical protein
MWLSCMLHWALLGAQQLETVHAFVLERFSNSAQHIAWLAQCSKQ